MTQLTFKVVFGPKLEPADEEAMGWCVKNMNKDVRGEFKVIRSPEHNRLFWAVARVAFRNLPERFTSAWASPYDMVKGLQLAFGIVDQYQKPTRDGWEVVAVPKSLDFGNMDQAEFNEVSDKLFKGMAHCLGIPVDDLLKEERNS